MFFWDSCFFDDPVNVGNLISGSSAFLKSSLNIWNFMVHVLLKPGLENFGYYFASVWDECNCAVVWAFFGIALLRDCNKNWAFLVLWPLLSFPDLLAYWVQHFYSTEQFRKHLLSSLYSQFLNSPSTQHSLNTSSIALGLAPGNWTTLKYCG